MSLNIVLSVLLALAIIGIVFQIVLLLKFKGSNQNVLNDKLVDYEKKLEVYERNLKDEFERNRKETSESERNSRRESQETLMNFQNSINAKLDNLTKTSTDTLTFSITKFMGTITTSFDSLSKSTQDALNNQKQTVQSSLKEMQDSNEKKLEQMRLTVDEKLQSTLEKRLNSSFELVSKQLEAVQKGLGEMQTLASDVGGLKRALTNVKSAGGMGEVQLEALLNDCLSPDQFEKNAHPNPNNARNVVEFAVKLPAKSTEREFIYLPIDSKYPATVWDKLTLAYEAGEKGEIDLQRKALIKDIRDFAKDIKEKYIQEPFTTNFGLMFLPFEGLYSEVTRIPGLFQELQDDFKVSVAGPTTLNAFLNSLQMGFRTLAIEKETSKVWELLGSVKTEFGKFGDVLAATKKKLESATTEIEKAETRTRVIEKKLGKVEALPETASDNLLEYDSE
ncbi:DNA recombination protein RmuC [Treponema pectinovorum]|uniref:DNA recombination protein RmuC n=1 Tax=Treponema pectinovorum TaxID=164 RepID=UPI0011CBE043|nr:DNA recombination protein RmuC [Treponema pectinovorum]